ncbi:hypothetical protein [Erwinia sp. S38]|uniref:hypothetical protein n=1 Tax=Erwinia sp. S38 TaxID=2769338 RepID=UPI0019099C25|nr:hypothetical protein [Erwinia sp. S38]MBK0003146.1 hypothetical protein [Erwinia sp. S38]
MNSLLINAGIPQLRCVFAGGRFVYEEKLPCASPADNYQAEWKQVDVESHWKNFNAIGGGYAVNPVDFIQKHIIEKLVSEGFPEDVAIASTRAGVDHYHRCSQASKKGAMFDDCLYHARQAATYTTPKSERPKRGRGSKSASGGLL